jgi:hypothetical protein
MTVTSFIQDFTGAIVKYYEACFPLYVINYIIS